MPVAYVGAVVGFVMVVGFTWPDRSAGLRDFLWVSLFFVLAAPSLQFAGLQMDHYGIYAMGDFAGTHLPYMLSLLLSLVLASVSAVDVEQKRPRGLAASAGRYSPGSTSYKRRR